MLTEKDLLIGCQKHDPKAQTAFYNRYKSKLMGVCKRYAKSAEDAEDIFQDAFIKIFNNIHTLQKAESVNHWVKQVVVNTAINFYHQNLKYKNHIDYEDVNEPNHEYQSILANLSTEELLVLINELPDGYRMVFNLYVIDGYNHIEIGEMLGVSENTSKSQLSRAKEHLRRKLKALGIINYERVG
jgi:RNA polymerase sigma factor (sigma-70 family)